MKAFLSLMLLINSSVICAGVENIAEPQVVWNKKEISVCFARYAQFKDSLFSVEENIPEASFSSFSKGEEEVIRTIINREYQEEKTGIHFSGWYDCDTRPDSDVYLFRLDDPTLGFTGYASVGEGGHRVYTDRGIFGGKISSFKKHGGKKKAFVALNPFQLSQYLPFLNEMEMTAVHEFGHLAGLRHEHADMTSDGRRYDDQNCKRAEVRLIEKTYSTTQKFSVYDQSSIMNYCYMALLRLTGLKFVLNKDYINKYQFSDKSLISTQSVDQGIIHKVRIGLSQGDLHALSCLYRYDSKTKQAICKPTFDPKVKR